MFQETPRKIIKVAAALVVANNQFLIAKRGKGRHLCDFWELPGGKVEQGETPEHTCVRELQEELQCTIKVERFFVNTEYDYPEFHLSMDVYLCSFIGEPHFIISEHQDAKLISAEEIDNYTFAPADIDFLPKIKELFPKS